MCVCVHGLETKDYNHLIIANFYFKNTILAQTAKLNKDEKFIIIERTEINALVNTITVAEIYKEKWMKRLWKLALNNFCIKLNQPQKTALK